MSAKDLAAAIRAKNLSPMGLVRAVYARLHKTNNRINAFCTLMEEEVVLGKHRFEFYLVEGSRAGILLNVTLGSCKVAIHDELRYFCKHVLVVSSQRQQFHSRSFSPN
jgi:hypothetical protein